MNFEKKPKQESISIQEQEEIPVSEGELNDINDYPKNVTEKIQDFFVKSAGEYLNKDSDEYLREQIIKFYSDKNRLDEELSQIFRGVKEDEILQKIDTICQSIDNKEDFIQYVETKNFATSPEERLVEEKRIRDVCRANDEEKLEVVRGEIGKIASDRIDGESLVNQKAGNDLTIKDSDAPERSVLGWIRDNAKLGKAFRAITLGVGLFAGINKTEAGGPQNKNQGDPVPEYYSLNNKIDLSGEKRKAQDSPENKKFFDYYDQKINKIVEHIQSPEYLKKLMVEFNISEDEAKKHQEIRLANVLKGTYYLDEKQNPGFHLGTKYFEVSLDKDTAGYEAEHEVLGHKAVQGNFGIPKETDSLLRESYKDFDPSSVNFKFKENYSPGELSSYFLSSAERYARKKALDIEMDDLGIKKYGENFTSEHSKKLLDFYKAGKLSKESNQFIETTKPEYLEKIFNEIADASEPKNSIEQTA
ncbi:MAG: hypothetical protein NT165_00165 [Candidatus Falkowbacteria bacterium]|nr:hypothetical protein [Candidatus Falkowbacteria bacterium]